MAHNNLQMEEVAEGNSSEGAQPLELGADTITTYSARDSPYFFSHFGLIGSKPLMLP